MKLRTIQAPLVLPVDLNSVKDFCRVLDDDEDAQIELMMKTALGRAEDITNLTLQGVTEYEFELDGFRDFKFPKSPLLDVVSIHYLQDGEMAELSIANYIEDNRNIPGTLEFLNVPTTSKVLVIFRAGYVKLPPQIESWLNVEVSTLYEHREQIVVGASVAINSRVDRLLDSFRIIPV